MNWTLGRRWACLALLLTLVGCSHLKGPFNPVEGQNFASDEARQIEEGTAEEEVLRLLGEPLEREPMPGGERWRYFVAEERIDELRFLGLIPVRQFRWERVTEATLNIAAGKVTKVAYNSEVIPPPE